MITKELLKEYSVQPPSDTFLLPLTGLTKSEKYELKCYLFWRDYTIHDYKLILCYSHDNLEEFTEWCRKNVFPVLDRNGYLIENYDIQGRSIFVLDMSEWAMDIQMFILGKYSKFSKEAKEKIKLFHVTKGFVDASIYGVIFPTEKLPILENKTFMEHISDFYGLDIEELRKVGETGSIYDKMAETLITDVDELCKTDIEVW